jgi:hypothetical protein
MTTAVPVMSRRPPRTNRTSTGTPTPLGRQRPVMGYREPVPEPDRIGGGSDISTYSDGAVRSGAPLTPTTRDVGSQELTSEQLNALLASDSPYVQGARSRAIRYQASRGLTPNSNLAGAAGETAAIESALPIAQSDAGVYDRTASENMEARNEFGIEGSRQDLERSLADARNRLDADRIYSEREPGALERNLSRERDEFQRRFSDQEREDIQRFQTDTARRETRAQATAYFMETVFSDPSFWRDPQGASGFVQFWNEVAWPMFDEIFGPLGDEGP